MLFLRYLIEIPLIFVAIWSITNVTTSKDDLIFALWPFQAEACVNVRLALCFFVIFGYIWAKINSWFNYSPGRHELRVQRKANKNLNKEQEKLNQTVNGLQKNIAGLQEKAKLQEEKYKADCPKKSFIQKFFGLFKVKQSSVNTEKDKK